MTHASTHLYFTRRVKRGCLTLACALLLSVGAAPLQARQLPRSQDRAGRGIEILSTFSRENMEADGRAFAALMRHLREVDAREQTVIMVQVENEIGMIPDSRDRSPAADKLYQGPVPPELLTYLEKNKETLTTELRAAWGSAGWKTRGTWEEVFGRGIATEEIFMAWHFARYTDRVAALGKVEYEVPMFVNAALIRPGYQPGQYPSAGPLPHLLDVPLIVEHQGKGLMAGLLAEGAEPQRVRLNGYALNVTYERPSSAPPAQANPGAAPPAQTSDTPSGGLVIATGPDEFVVAGTGLVVVFEADSPGDPVVGIMSAQEGKYVNGRWTPGRWLNGDQTHQGRHIRLPSGRFDIQRVKLYRYR